MEKRYAILQAAYEMEDSLNKRFTHEFLAKITMFEGYSNSISTIQFPDMNISPGISDGKLISIDTLHHSVSFLPIVSVSIQQNCS